MREAVTTTLEAAACAAFVVAGALVAGLVGGLIVFGIVALAVSWRMST